MKKKFKQAWKIASEKKETTQMFQLLSIKLELKRLKKQYKKGKQK